MLRNKKLILVLAELLFIVGVTLSQNSAQVTADEQLYNFGLIGESDGMVSHIFLIHNTGNAPLVITRITASCGCTQPEWSKDPIAAGKSTEVKVTYNPKGRPGPFYKTITIFSNAKNSYTLAIKGTVVAKTVAPAFQYPYNIGALKMETKNVDINAVRFDETVEQKISVTNSGRTSLTIQLGKTPRYLSVEAHPGKLAPDEVCEITFRLNAKEVKHKGRLIIEIPAVIQSIGKKTSDQGTVRFSANIIDNFDKQSIIDKWKAPVAYLSGTLLEFGQVNKKGGHFPLLSGKVTGTVDITNNGRSKLIIYSVTCDDEIVDLSGGRREIKPGEKSTFKISIRPKDIQTRLETLVTFICNDPNGPVRIVKVTAYK